MHFGPGSREPELSLVSGDESSSAAPAGGQSDCDHSTAPLDVSGGSVSMVGQGSDRPSADL
ncbi:hypothetical protein ACEWX3_13085 [Mycobacterium sp. G7A2]|uniref:hypothetical protein n=1 Tax=Mycobacteriaceae TaxID=1762 RepID=UPI0035A8D9FA